MARTVRPILILLLLLSGCSSLEYYSQAVGGHVRVMLAARPIQEVIADPSVDPDLKKQLEEVRVVRDFASRELALPENDSYRSYADLKRPFVIWNVFATHEFSLETEKWCMLIVGCVSYRGFYAKEDAESLANNLRRQGFDTFVGGIPAYSTLGYFNDPVLNTFMKSGSTDVARVIFHELAHQLLYVEGDTVFNESFAVTVENEGLRRWLAHQSNPGLDASVAQRNERREVFVALVERYRDKLRELYDSDLSEQAKRSAKTEIMAQMKRTYLELPQAGGGPAVYQAWFERDLNNAKIASLGLYTQLVPVFESLLHAEGGDLRRFYQRVKALAQLPSGERKAAVRRLQLAAAGAPSV